MQYLKSFLIGLASLLISLIIITLLVFALVLLLPLIWAFLTLIWINTVKNGLAFMNGSIGEEEIIEDEEDNNK